MSDSIKSALSNSWKSHKCKLLKHLPAKGYLQNSIKNRKAIPRKCSIGS